MGPDDTTPDEPGDFDEDAFALVSGTIGGCSNPECPIHHRR